VVTTLILLLVNLSTTSAQVDNIIYLSAVLCNIYLSVNGSGSCMLYWVIVAAVS
jgi:hypothetical protein